MSLIDNILGRPLASSEEGGQKIGVLAGVPILGLDGLSSAAYGPEAALTILLPLGLAGLNYIAPVTFIILALLGVLYLSYRQTIAAYPNGGGSYTVAKENLGVRFGLLAGAALMLDYTLNVAVGISSGVGALVSAVPGLHSHILGLCLGFLGLITLVNLRGVREAGTVFALPTYLFVGTLAVVIIGGISRGGLTGHAHPLYPPTRILPATAGVSLWLLMRAFASGCTAMTGVEAVSNGVAAFAEPRVANAQRTLTAIVAILACLLAGIALLCHGYHIGVLSEDDPQYQSVLSQLASAVVGRGTFYYITIAAVIAVVVLSANTSYAGFPRLCRLIALDDYLPHAFRLLGRRLVYTVGIVFLTGIAGILLIVFKGITDRLIPLFAVGAFLAFTLSQAGMVQHWRKNSGASGKDRGRAAAALTINSIGAVATMVALAVILVAKFAEGAWISILIIPALLALFLAIKRHYVDVANQTCCLHPLDLKNLDPPVVVVPFNGWDLQTERALRFALRLSPDVVAVHVGITEDASPDQTDDQSDSQKQDEAQDDVRRLWERDIEAPAKSAGLPAPKLEIVQSPYRKVVKPLLEFVNQIQERYPGRIVAVAIPELVETRWWQLFLHNHLATALKASLLLSGKQRVVVIDIPWYLKDFPSNPPG
jgi:amino acid transporter